ncbi:vitamin K epoxide reductase family protein [Umezawaea tangerina]|uniref:Putative membrane protein n=1 Tax=Umezawaea tangerina TaxID=84725 RepID=A0A2T0TAU9_9PSEU|nr:vitamin K epoxide reductase family protein [Umezawaea tangerina]PRY42780.1 putative membrane protein [Umezawaea tangerina]
MLKTSRVPLISLVLALAGLAVSVYLTIAHYGAPELLVCSENSVVDCATVTSSEQSELLGIPVAVLGALFYAFLTAICLPWAWRSASPWVGWVRLASVGVGVLFVVYLVAAEFLLIGKICLWCTVVHVITLALAGLLVAAALRPSNV